MNTDNLKNEAARLLARAARIEHIAPLLPAGIRAPTISNETDSSAWLSFSTEADNALTVLRALESAGFEPAPVSLVGYGTWRASPQHGTADEQPSETRSGALRVADDLAPLWLSGNWCGHRQNAEACAYYRRAGMVFRVSVDVNALQLLAPTGTKGGKFGRPIEWTGARLVLSETMHTLFTADGESVADRSAASRAWLESGTYATAAVYWTPHVDGFNLTPADILAQVLATKRSA